MACLHPITWMNGWSFTKLVHLYCLDMEKNWLDFGDLTPFSRSQEGSDCWNMAWLHPISRMNGWILSKLRLVTLTSFSRSHNGLDCWKMACLHPISWRNGWIMTQLAQLYCCDMKKNWFNFGDLDPISRSQEGSVWKVAFLHPISRMNGWILTKLVQLYCWNGQELIRFWWPWPHFQGHTRA